MKSGFFDGGVKTVATIASTGAAVASIVTFLHAWGVVGDPASRASFGNVGAKWIGVRPLVDTARTVRDTIHLAATITDKNGSILFGARPTWTTENPDVATVEQDGSVIARGAGKTTIIAVVGELSARTRIVVHQTVAAVRIAGDSTITMSEGETRALELRAFDARGYVVPNRAARWAVEDGTAIAFDSAGRAVASDAGRAVVTATVDGVSAQALVTVAPSPAAIAAVKGNGQRGAAGATLADRVIVRVVNRRGKPVEGTLVRFRPEASGGVADPAAAVTDADGRARTTWTLAEVPGRQQLLASVERVDTALVLHAEADPIAANTRIVALADSVLATVAAVDTVGIRITDTTGRALADVPVRWEALDGVAKPLGERTDSAGEARVEWTLGRKAGAQRMRARVGGDVTPLTVVALAKPGNAARVEVDRLKSGKAAAPREIGIAVTVKDEFGNAVPQATVRLAAKSGAVAQPAVTSDSTGRASVTWTIADKAGDQLLVASIKGSGASDTLKARAPKGQRPKPRS